MNNETNHDLGVAAELPARPARRRWALLGASMLSLAAAGALLHQGAHAQPMMFGPGGHGPGGWHGGLDGDPAAQAKRIEAMVAFMLADVDATAEQRDRIATIMKGAANDLQANRRSHMEARRQAMTLLAAPTIDRAQLEKLRVEQMQLGDNASRRMLQAMIDSAEVLTPAQRAKLAERRQRQAPPRN
jgi:Spy/CpxP family protein refolding chaperone